MILLMMWICFLLNCTCQELKGKERPIFRRPPRRVGGDPHYTTWVTSFSYHGECDLVLVKSTRVPSESGLEIHIRTKMAGSFSFVQAVSVRVGRYTFEMEGKDKFYINGQRKTYPPSKFAGYPLTQVQKAPWCQDKCSNARIFRISFTAEEYVELVYWAGVLHVEFNGPNFEDSTGLLGGSGEGFVSRKGDPIKNVNEFGQEWQVTDSDPKLFYVKRDPQRRCKLPSKAIDPFRKRVFFSMATSACSHLSGDLRDMCMFDVTATGNVDMALSPLYN